MGVPHEGLEYDQRKVYNVIVSLKQTTGIGWDSGR